MTLELVPYDRRHLKGFRPGRQDLAHVRCLQNMPGWEGKAVTARENNRTLGIAGVGMEDEAAHMWLVLSDEMRRRPVSLCRLARWFLRGIVDRAEVSSICIEVDNSQARRWAEWLGFKAIDSRRMEYGGHSYTEDGSCTRVKRDFGSRLG